MHTTAIKFSSKEVSCFLDAEFEHLKNNIDAGNSIIVTDENVAGFHLDRFKGFKVISFSAGESHKTQATVDFIIEKLIEYEATKDSLLIGVGGGIVTDVTGYVASIYMRGVKFGLVPTSILAMVDAAIGGKNGIDVGVYKNMVGTICQPEFIYYDYSFLETLPRNEWINGFAEVIKHACIRDLNMFSVLEKFVLEDFQRDKTKLAELIEKNISIKAAVVTMDEFESGERKILNFGHTIGHAIENLHHLPHGHAISIGMIAACNLSERLNKFHFQDAQRIVKLLTAYHLPVMVETDHRKIFEVLKMDKKRKEGGIYFILLKNIGEAEIKFISLADLELNFKEIL